MTDLIKIENHEVNRIMYKGKPVVTFKMVDELHERPEGTARVTFNRNKKRFIQDYHFFEVPHAEWSQITAVCLTYGGPDTGQRNSMKFFTEPGYLLLVKPFSDDRAWKVQDTLIRDYFKIKEMIENSTHQDSLSENHKNAVVVLECVTKAGELLGTSKEMARVVGVKTAKELTGVDFQPLLTDNTVEEKPMTPTELAKIHGVSSGRKMNTVLEQAGLQIRKGKVWEATEEGREHSTLDPYQSEHSNHTGYRLLWFASVLDLLSEQDAA